MTREDLGLALVAFHVHGTPARISSAITARGRDGLASDFDGLGESDQREIRIQAAQLEADGVDALIFGDREFPNSLLRGSKPIAPVLFLRGNRALLGAKGIGMCGSRNVSTLGLQAAKGCGVEVSRQGLAVVSGYAKGVDTETHLAALTTGGSTVIVLAEGINHFRVKKAFKDVLDPARTLVISQFAPDQPWKSFAAMARNEVIVGLGSALVVVEAGEKGGTLAAGKSALKVDKPLLVLDFAESTPPGNVQLLTEGGHAVSSVEDLRKILHALASGGDEWAQAALF